MREATFCIIIGRVCLEDFYYDCFRNPEFVFVLFIDLIALEYMLCRK